MVRHRHSSSDTRADTQIPAPPKRAESKNRLAAKRTRLRPAEMVRAQAGRSTAVKKPAIRTLNPSTRKAQL